MESLAGLVALNGGEAQLPARLSERVAQRSRQRDLFAMAVLGPAGCGSSNRRTQQVQPTGFGAHQLEREIARTLNQATNGSGISVLTRSKNEARIVRRVERRLQQELAR